MSLALALALTICPASGLRTDCVVDGDTGWFGREKWRIENIDTPELRGKCAKERRLAIRARNRLLTLLNSGPVMVQRFGFDRMQTPRRLVRLSVNGRDVGETLIAEGLARRWHGKRKGWCA